MLLKSKDESSETYLNPLVADYPDIFLQPIDASAQGYDFDATTRLQYLIKSDDEKHFGGENGAYELRQVRLFESFICTLNQVRMYRDQESPMINMEQLAILLIDFYEKVRSVDAIHEHFVLHSSQLVLIRDAQECKY